MSIQGEWRAIATRIDGLVAASGIYLRCLAIHREERYRVAEKSILPQCVELRDLLRVFAETHQPRLPPLATAAIQRFMAESVETFTPGVVGGFFGINACLTPLAALRSELEYHLTDFSAVARRLTERAFLHLQRTIVVDATSRERWKAAFDAGEAECERLGGVHLLVHGIWAFKAHSEGERTDLVLGEPIRDLTSVEGIAEALVLTEWKKVTKATQTAARAGEAMEQARRYGVGSLAGMELSSHRYVVLVSKGRLPPIPDASLDGIAYRHINISVDPGPPSRP